ncbi:hypothetical protein SLEP1_g37525 [Rubroshorea leprosula]|uniref:Uncharacterized protein n=1 Tax=Rubroshorea leprosula TaxID=152421 RepID=A0AAV5KV29_9ROSI|nr:hypothetical protein SLEP1_g37525 [Rubroshorea leprosula]
MIKYPNYSIQEKVGARESLHGGSGHGIAGNREQEGSCADKVTFADLDADLDKYRLETLKKK